MISNEYAYSNTNIIFCFVDTVEIFSEESDEAESKSESEELDEFDENDYSEDSMIGVPLNEKDYDSEGASVLIDSGH